MLASKRTRVNVRQSKNGCFTCRARKKKCDESRPSCLRCLKAKRVCEGYHVPAPPARPTESALVPLHQVRSLSGRPSIDHLQSRFAQLGLEVLTQEAGNTSFGLCNHIWLEMLPQLSNASTLIHSALASLGSTYEAVVLRAGDNSNSVVYAANVQYHNALAALRNEVSLPKPDCAPLFLACVVLAAVEVLMRHLINALQHLRGAFAIMTQHSGLPRLTQSPSSPMIRKDMTTKPGIKGDCGGLYLLAQALDMQTSSYALSRPLDLPIAPQYISEDHPELLLEPMTPQQAHIRYLPLLHACYQFAVGASAYKYIPRSKIPADVLHDQNRYLARLTRSLLTLDRLLAIAPYQRKMSTYSTPSNFLPLLVLKVQCLSVMIYVSTKLTPYEISYDAYTQHFEQIVDSAAILLELSDEKAWHSGPARRFRLVSPVSQPLYLTAMKCRHGTIRRGAIDLLSVTGREGPWDGALFARIARRAVEIEEDGLHTREAVSLDSAGGLEPSAVPEAVRLHGCGVDSDQAHAAFDSHVVLTLSQCKDVDRMMEVGDGSSDESEHWRVWTETISTKHPQ